MAQNVYDTLHVVGARQIKDFLRVLLRAADGVKLYA